jgi:hypothetical protein
MNSTEKNICWMKNKVKLIQMYCESFILTSHVFVVLCHVFDVLLIKWKPKNITLSAQFLNLIEKS